ncbi:hypothetical protein TSOC_005299 [Tetrabaena socialis]|uniref:Uncharacterized protein n=1 Tax=Tetrabaena socialis TaxID=47790 RepID=A0A2J8A6L3_9CHLO|nr:hypothetical protein TSOC_005299 [Tetrabaena socialis]|eukprot:PNH08154.1 hypothetical protein TSOC_005299 [Tetrabaena socialis]
MSDGPTDADRRTSTGIPVPPHKATSSRIGQSPSRIPTRTGLGGPVGGGGLLATLAASSLLNKRSDQSFKAAVPGLFRGTKDDDVLAQRDNRAGMRRPSPARTGSKIPDVQQAPAQSDGPGPASSSAATKALPRASSVCRHSQLPRETRSSLLRSLSVGKGRNAAPQGERTSPAPGGSRAPPGLGVLRPASARTEKRSTFVAGSSSAVRGPSAGRQRPISAPLTGPRPVKADVTHLAQQPLVTITEAPARPTMSLLNLSALKQQAPSPPAAGSTAGLRSTSSEELGPPVPKLNLGGILAKREEEQAGQQAPQQEQASRKSASSKEEAPEHFYVYPKVNPLEKKRIDDVCKVLPKKQQTAVTDLFGKMVEARQNCEQMCFRGHRLLDQAQTEFKNRLAAKEEEKEQWRQEAEFLRQQLTAVLGAERQPDDAAGQDEEDQGGSCSLEQCNSLMCTFDSLAMLGEQAREPLPPPSEDE